MRDKIADQLNGFGQQETHPVSKAEVLLLLPVRQKQRYGTDLRVKPQRLSVFSKRTVRDEIPHLISKSG